MGCEFESRPCHSCKFPSPMSLREWSQSFTTLPHFDCAQNCARSQPKRFPHILLFADGILAEYVLRPVTGDPHRRRARDAALLQPPSDAPAVVVQPIRPDGRLLLGVLERLQGELVPQPPTVSSREDARLVPGSQVSKETLSPSDQQRLPSDRERGTRYSPNLLKRSPRSGSNSSLSVKPWMCSSSSRKKRKIPRRPAS